MLEAFKIDFDKKTTSQINLSEIKGHLDKNIFSDFIFKDKGFVWIDISNVAGTNPCQEEMQIMQEVLNLHPLVIEDCITRKHLPKAEEHSNYNFFIISKMTDAAKKEINSSKISFVVGKKFILTYRHIEIKEILNIKKQLLSKPSDFSSPIDIFYLVTDQVIDDYVSIVENYTTKIYEIEETVFAKPDSHKTLKDINFIRKNLIILRRNTLLEKKIFSSVVSGEIDSLDFSQKVIYFRDICDHLDKVLAKIDNQKEYITGILNIQVGLTGQKLNNLVKFLTIISAVLLPATLLASIFGMNFAHMPLVQLTKGFYTILLIMAGFGFGTFILFYNKKWL